jgi:hypothetical protein
VSWAGRCSEAHQEPSLNSLACRKACQSKCLKSSGRADRLADPRPSLPREPEWSVRQGAPGATSCSSAVRSAPRTFSHHQARGTGLPLHYQYRDCAALPNRPPGLAPAAARGPEHHNLGKGVRSKAQGGRGGGGRSQKTEARRLIPDPRSLAPASRTSSA